MESIDLTNCKHEIETKILKLENQVLQDVIGIKKDVTTIKEDLEKLITRPEFEPVKLIAFGLAGGVLIAALGAVFAKVLGW